VRIREQASLVLDGLACKGFLVKAMAYEVKQSHYLMFENLYVKQLFFRGKNNKILLQQNVFTKIASRIKMLNFLFFEWWQGFEPWT